MARILVVHGDERARDALHALLSRLGHDCDCTVSPVLALEQAIASVPDLIVIGDHVPDLEGSTLLELVRCFLGTRCPPVLFAPKLPAEQFVAEISAALPTAFVFGKAAPAAEA